jgi:hypothetical protein
LPPAARVVASRFARAAAASASVGDDHRVGAWQARALDAVGDHPRVAQHRRAGLERVAAGSSTASGHERERAGHVAIPQECAYAQRQRPQGVGQMIERRLGADRGEGAPVNLGRIAEVFEGHQRRGLPLPRRGPWSCAWP